MAGNNKGIVEQLVAVLSGLFDFSKPEGMGGWMRFVMQCMVAFILFIFVLQMFMNALGMGGDMLSPITGPVGNLLGSLFGGGAPVTPQG